MRYRRYQRGIGWVRGNRGACSTPRRWVFAPCKSASVQTKRDHLAPKWGGLTFTSTPKDRGNAGEPRLQKNWEGGRRDFWQTAPRAEQQSPDCFPGLSVSRESSWVVCLGDSDSVKTGVSVILVAVVVGEGLDGERAIETQDPLGLPASSQTRRFGPHAPAPLLLRTQRPPTRGI